jgi:hypothetical protein
MTAKECSEGAHQLVFEQFNDTIQGTQRPRLR